MTRCFIVQPIHPAGVERLRAAGIEPRFASATDMGAVAAEIGDAVAVITRDAGLTAAAIAAAPRLAIIANHGIGTNKLDIPAATARRIPIVNTPTANARSVAEHAIALILAVARRIVPGDAALRQGDWAFRYSGGMSEIGGKTLGLAGFGTIARITAEIARLGFGMRVVVWSPNAPAADIAAAGYERVETLEALLAAADVLSLHRPARPDTRHMIDAGALAQMKPGAILVNTARGPLIDEDALAAALRAGQIAGAGLDVFDTEPLAADSPLCGLQNIVITPHVAGATEDALRATALDCAEKIVTVLDGTRPPHLVNPEVWDNRCKPDAQAGAA